MPARGLRLGRALAWASAFFVAGLALLAVVAPGAAGAVALIPLMLFLVAFVWLWNVLASPVHWKQNEAYAATLFDGLAPYENVEASRRRHPVLGGRGFLAWDCTYAIVTLAADASHVPPTRHAGNDLGWQFDFGGDWAPTPFPPLGDSTRDAVGTCAADWPSSVGVSIKAALAAPGSWYWTDGVGEEVHVYSVPQRVAARIRYGD